MLKPKTKKVTFVIENGWNRIHYVERYLDVVKYIHPEGIRFQASEADVNSELKEMKRSPTMIERLGLTHDWEENGEKHSWELDIPLINVLAVHDGSIKVVDLVE